MKYRPDIDGLRALAVLFVIMYHAGLSLFPSGFVGVDIFFVISGYLITYLIYQDLEKGKFSFAHFYKRRLWRLQPAFIIMLLITAILTMFFYLPDDLIDYSRSARKTSLFIANQFFNRATTGYFAPDSNQLPLLHTWSLSVEWQCYLLLPLGIWLLHRVFSRFRAIIYTFTGIFFMVTMFYSIHAPANTYFLFSSRIFEFLVGASLAVSIRKPIQMRFSLLNGISIVAVILIFYIAILPDIKLGFPNSYTLILCLSTVALIAVGNAPKKSIISQLLSIRPVVFIGTLSYSLYLWHWPIFAFIRYQSIEETPMVVGLAFSIIFVSAYLSWRYIEKPARQLSHLKFSHSLVYLLILPILFVHLSDFVIKKNAGFPQRFNEELTQITKALNQYNHTQRSLCIDHPQGSQVNCIVGSQKENRRSALMIGDSFSNHYWEFMNQLGKDGNVGILLQGTSSCLTLPGIYLYDWWHFKNQVYKECRTQTEHYYQMIQAQHYDFVIIGQVWENYLGTNVISQLKDERSEELTKRRIEKSLDEALKIIINAGATPVLIKSTAAMKTNFRDCFFKHIKLHQAYDPKQCSFYLQENARAQWMNNLFAKMRRKYSKLVLIDPKKVQCPKGICKADINGIPMYRDVGHITDYASDQLGILYIQNYKNPFNA